MRSVDLIMNKNERSTTTLLSAIVISSLLASAFLLVGSMNFSQKAMGQAEEVFSENATSTEEAGAIDNQTAPAATNATTTNQTAPTPAPTIQHQHLHRPLLMQLQQELIKQPQQPT